MGLFFGHNQMSGVDNDFVFTIDTTKGTGDSFTLPLRNLFVYDFIVDWGDGNSSEITSNTDPDMPHTYAVGGVYQLRISGKCEAWSFSRSGDCLKLISIENWGSLGLKACDKAFDGCSNLLTLPSGSITWIPITVGATGGYYRMFTSCSKLQSIPLNFLDLAISVQSFNSMFWECFAIRSIPEDLLYHCNGLYYSGMFRSTRYIVLPSRIFDLSKLSVASSFTNFMDTAAAYSPTGTIQDIWNYTTATSTDAFNNCTAITNYADIPLAWK